MNAIIGEKLSIVTPKAQTTRHRIFGILNDDNHQIVFSDTPGIIIPKYELQKNMMKFVSHSLEDADVILCVIDITDDQLDQEIIDRLKKTELPVVFVLNKIDISSEAKLAEKMAWCNQFDLKKEIIALSALANFNVDNLVHLILKFIPEHPAFYDKEDLTDKPERFFAAEIIREKIFLNYSQEIPYSCEVMILGFKEKPDMNVITAEIYVERDSQKGILIGKNGVSLKRIGIQARVEMEKFFGKKVFLETHVRVVKDWRSDPNKLKKFGYDLS
jgi:GTP-binding protein Era